MSETEISSQARAWFLRLLDKPGEAELCEFRTWLAADPAHDAAFRSIRAGWEASRDASRRLADAEAGELAGYLRAMDAPRQLRRASKPLIALCVVLTGALLGGFWLQEPHLLENLSADHVTGRGERRIVALADGSTVELDADSAIAATTGTGERRFRLLRGGGFFTVVPSTKPFVVEAAGGEVRVLGTAFDLRVDGSQAVVTVASGSVSVAGPGQGRAVLKPSEQARYGESGVGPTARVDVRDALAWRDGRLVFYRRPLAEVLAEIERYSSGRIFVVSPGLGDELVTGSLVLADGDHALESLRASVGFKVNRLSALATFVRR